MPKFKDLTGDRFGQLTVLYKVRGTGIRGRPTKWQCLCDCGGATDVFASNLVRSHTTSCGCHKENARLTHGLSHMPEYKIWTGMKGRCQNPKDGRFRDYGGRGVTVCQRWADSFEMFFLDMGPRPSPNHSLDRIDVNGNYEAANCRWATRVEQQNNMRRNLSLSFNGRSQTAAQWAREIGMNPATLTTRLRRGWSVGVALTTPIQKKVVPSGQE